MTYTEAMANPTAIDQYLKTYYKNHRDDDMDDGGAQRWLASKLVSPITGMAPVLTAKSGLAKKGKKKKRKREE